jgi:GT2 family glycosyltransferase
VLERNNVAAVIVAYNVNHCINSLKSQVNYICVIDNSTIDENFYHDKIDIKYIKNYENLGLGKAYKKWNDEGYPITEIIHGEVLILPINGIQKQDGTIKIVQIINNFI